MGHKIEHLSDINRPKGETYDIHFDGEKADLKSVSSHNNIEKYVRHAVRDQGANTVIVRLESKADIKNQLFHYEERKGNMDIVFYIIQRQIKYLMKSKSPKIRRAGNSSPKVVRSRKTSPLNNLCKDNTFFRRIQLFNKI